MAKFKIPHKFLEKLYDLTGDGKKNKGYMLFYFDNEGIPRTVVTRQDGVVLSALRKNAETLLRSMDEQESIGTQSFQFDE